MSEETVTVAPLTMSRREQWTGLFTPCNKSLAKEAEEQGEGPACQTNTHPCSRLSSILVLCSWTSSLEVCLLACSVFLWTVFAGRSDRKDWEKPIWGSNPGSILPYCDAKDGWWAGGCPWYMVPSWHIKAVVQMQSSKGRWLFFLLFCRGNTGDSGTLEDAPVVLWKWWMKMAGFSSPELPLAVNSLEGAVTQIQGGPRSDQSLPGRVYFSPTFQGV